MTAFRFALLLFFLFACSLALAESAPTFALPTNSDTVALDSLRGQVLYLDFWASWCEPCRKSFPWMEKLRIKYADQGLTVIAINLDPARKNADKFLAKQDVGFTIAFDPKGEIAKAYQVKGMPSSFLINRAGDIVFSRIGFKETETDGIEKQIMELLAQ
jgi:peroxiredoxin